MSTKTTNTAPQVNPGVSVITEETFETLKGMIKSSDPADHLVAQMILTQVDVQKSIYWIWKLAIVNSHRMVNLRTKAGRAFRDDSNLFYLSNASATGFGSWLVRRGWITDDIYQRIKKDLVNEAGYGCQSGFFEYSIALKDELKHLDPSASPIILKDED
jgi:hypothetical protein